MVEYNAAVCQKKEERKAKRLSTKLAQALASADQNKNIQSADNQAKKILNNNVEKQHIVLDMNVQIYRKKLGDVLTQVKG